jgi:hypothetical protein
MAPQLPQATSFDNNYIPLHLTQLSSASLDSSLSDNYRKAPKKKKKSRKKSSSSRRREQRDDYRDDYDDESSESDESIENRVKQRHSSSRSGRVEEFHRRDKSDQQHQQHQPQRYKPAPPIRELQQYDYSNRLPGIPQQQHESKSSHPLPHQNTNLNLRQPRAHPPGPRPNQFTFDGHTPTSQGTSAFYGEKRIPTNIPNGVHRQFGYPQVTQEGPSGGTPNSFHTRQPLQQPRGPVITPQSRASSHGGHRDELEAAIVLGSKIASSERSDMSAAYSRASAPFAHPSSFDRQLPYPSSNISDPLSGLSKNMRGMQLQSPILSTQSLQHHPVGRPRTPSGGNSLKEVIVPPGNMGITIKSSNKGPIVVDVHPMSICREIRPGDIILALDGVDVSI